MRPTLVTVDGLNFSLTQDPSATVSFHNGAFSGLSFDGTDITGLFKIDTLGTSGTSYDLVQDVFGRTLSQGSISAVDPPPSTPLPPTIVLFGGALLLIGAFAWAAQSTKPSDSYIASGIDGVGDGAGVSGIVIAAA